MSIIMSVLITVMTLHRSLIFNIFMHIHILTDMQNLRIFFSQNLLKHIFVTFGLEIHNCIVCMKKNSINQNHNHMDLILHNIYKR